MKQIIRSNFFDINKNKSIHDIINDSPSIIENKIPNNFSIKDISTPDNLINNSIIFLNKNMVNNFISNINNNTSFSIHAFIDSNDSDYKKLKSYTLVGNLKTIYNNIVNNLIIHPDHLDYKDKFIKKNNSLISNRSNIHKTSIIGNNCIIGKGVSIGKNCIIKDNVVIKNAILEDNIIIHENSVIGSTGFGFNAKDTSVFRLEPQIGIVYISSNCSIGSSCTIDRGKINYTFFGEFCMLDNQVHIAHNVSLGSNVIIAAQSGIAGSTKIGNKVMIGGQTGISGHLNIGNNVVIAAKSGVTKNISSNSVVAGFPAVDIKRWKKMIINQRKI